MANSFNCLEQSLENLKVKASINVEYKLPNLNEYIGALTNQTVLKKENPQDTYEVGDVLGEGGYACVAFVTRKSDGHKFAMKIVNYHAMDFSAKEMENMHNEIGILQVHKADHICFCVEAYDWKKSAWLILELMEDNITSFFDVEVDYSENVCKYIMRETLKGIRYLHQRHIVHRDIKSDNILFN
jgi:serine/threonine protein kinase